MHFAGIVAAAAFHAVMGDADVGIDRSPDPPGSILPGFEQGLWFAGIETAFAEQAFAGSEIDNGKQAACRFDDMGGALCDTVAAVSADFSKQVFVDCPRRSQRDFFSSEITAKKLHSTYLRTHQPLPKFRLYEAAV